MKKLLARLFGRLADGFLGPIKNVVKKINKKLDPFFSFSWELGSLAAKIGFIFKGLVAIVMSIFSLILVILNLNSIVDVIKGTVQGQSFWLEKLENVISNYPSFQSVVTTMDSHLSAVGTYFTPPLTFSYILRVTGIGDAVNTIIVCAVQGLAFVISMRLLFWSLGRVKLQMVKPIK
jgi:hypothetical protein